ncbi:diguanylate cyclase [Magnetospirillum sp. UT-4]|uniref:diguanylate cyclase n=1 Tax=Magnetospirillum sp. UT-4 TaxID=2681467 RepID=UPI001382FACE|nr:diguanylate cyclase [Magnetospirillum sp. UT-4]CAA7613213.1 Diguanylate cyclase [Magnetospirillum sp. UT-4]
MQVERTRDMLRLCERVAVEHLAWLLRVHTALMLPGEDPVPAEPDAPCLATCGEDGELAALVRLRAAMQATAGEVTTAARRDGRLDPERYRRFMAAVDAYGREARRVETHFRRLLAETDPLTGLHNRQGMMRDLKREWMRALRTDRPVCLALADLDHFKRINDTWGHLSGDRVLCAAARFFQRRLRPYDMVYRYGGEEFLFCLPDTDADKAAHVLDRLRRALARLPVTVENGERVPVTCSIGVALMVPGRTVHEAIGAADRALYAAKDEGRNRVAKAPPETPAVAGARSR